MTEGVWSICYKCRSTMWLPTALETVARASPGKVSVYCAYGHEQVYSEGETQLDKMRRERDRLAQQIAERDDALALERRAREAADTEALLARRSAAAARGRITKLKNRVGNGVCPCCNRTFGNLARHMHTQHPTFKAEESNVVPIKAAS